MAVGPESTWRIVCEREHFAGVHKDDPDFWQLLALARVVNSLWFARAAIPPDTDDSPAGVRQRFNSFFYTAALLFEGLRLAQRLRKTYGEQEYYRTGFGEILRNKDYQRLFSQNLKPLRDRATFHFDEEHFGAQLAWHELDELVFVRGRGRTQDQTYYQLADVLAMRLAVGQVESAEELLERAAVIMRHTAELSIKFVEAADRFLGKALVGSGWRLEQDT